MRKSRFPDSLVLIFSLIILAQGLTYLLPAGEFERDGRQVIQGTYHRVDAEPLPPYAFLTAVPKGLEEAADIIFFIFIVGGVFAGAAVVLFVLAPSSEEEAEDGASDAVAWQLEASPFGLAVKGAW